MPFVYKVHTIRDGRSYCTRIVNVTQAEGKGICFTCTCSFKTDETSPLDVQEHVDIWKRYKAVLAGKTPEDFPEAPGMDVPFYRKMLEKEPHRNEKFPGLQNHKADMRAYNHDKAPLDRRQLIFYRPLGELPDDPNIHMCAHLYASDRNSLYIVANHLEVSDSFTQMGSLAHTVISHAPYEQLRFKPAVPDNGPQGNWYVKEDWTTRVSVGRAMYHSHVWSPDGTHIATLMQDGMLRVGEKPKDASKL